MDEGLIVGDFLPDFPLFNPRQGGTTLLRQVRGKAIVLLFFGDGHKPVCQAHLRAFAKILPRLDRLAHVFAITPQPAEANARLVEMTGFPVEPLLSDPEGQLARLYGVTQGPGLEADVMGSGSFSSVVAGPNQRILAIWRGADDPGLAGEILSLLERADAEPAQVMRPYAPVLYVPGVFDPTFCRHLIEVFENRGSELTGVNRSYDAGVAGVDVKDTKVKVRRDHTVQDPVLAERINRFMVRRLLPEVARAFGHRITHAEAYMIGCYDQETGGYFRPHRDNVSHNTRQRRFALSLNLNTGEYQGGQLRFPEYGPHLYNPAAGDAVVFSCSLLHEALPVTAGRRFVLLTFFYGPDGRDVPGTMALLPG